MSPNLVGAIEGFYGTPWSWKERRTLCDAVAAAGGNAYVYAPKDDPLHRDRWRELYPSSWTDRLEELVSATTVRVGVAISPGLSIDPDAHHDRRDLATKVRQLLDSGISLIALTLDDVPFAPDQGAAHGRLTAWLRDQLDDQVDLVMVPNHYTGCVSTPYLEGLRVTVPREVPIGWTGAHVVNDRITRSELDAWTTMMEGRAPLLWDNYPVNDLVMSDRLFLGPLRGREPAVAAGLSGYLANGGVQAIASIPPIRSAVAWATGGDPHQEWASAIGDAEVLGRCVDEFCLSELLDAGDLDAADALLAAAETCEAASLGEAVGPWVDAVRAEAAVGRIAIRLLRDPEASRRTLELMALGVSWPSVRRHAVSVFGPRQGFRPVMGQDAEGNWTCGGAAIDHDRNAIDRLVVEALAASGSDIAHADAR